MATPLTVASLRRWSCQDAQLPPVNQIQAIHIYDFDNTLFSSPLPNKQLWNTPTCGHLQAQDFLHNGGWWHNPAILAATGQGVEKEEARAWEGNWNEKIVDLVRLSMQDDQTLNVLLTGRSETGFRDLISRMVAAKKLEFDMVCLKPSAGPDGEIFSSTMGFKQALLRDMVFTYHQADELRIYEDRPKHTKGFRDFFTDLNQRLMAPNPALPYQRPPFTAEVIQVTEQDSNMDPASEVTQVQKMINEHNQAFRDGTTPQNTVPYKIKRSVFYTGYLINQSDMDRLRTLIKLPANCPEHEMRYLANNILITPRPAAPSILNKVGGIGAKMMWKVTGIAVYEQRVWAARVQPVSPDARIYTENKDPCVVLATRRQAKPIEASRIQNWQPVPNHLAFEFETTVGEKVLLRIEQEVEGEDDYEASFPNTKNARKHPRDEEYPPGRVKTQFRSSPRNPNAGKSAWQNKTQDSSQRGGRGSQRGSGFRGGRGGRGDSRGGGRGGRGRGTYRSLDDNPGQGYGSGGMQY